MCSKFESHEIKWVELYYVANVNNVLNDNFALSVTMLPLVHDIHTIFLRIEQRTNAIFFFIVSTLKF